MTWTAPRTWAALERLTTALLNTHLRDNLLALASPPMCQVWNTAGISCTSGTATLMTFDSELYDLDWAGAAGSWHSTSTNTSRVVIPYDGTYRIRWFWQWPSAPTTCTPNLRLNSAGSSTGGSSLRSPIYTDRSGEHSIERAFTAGDYVELFLTQSSGGTLTNTAGGHVTGISAIRIGG